MKTRIAPIAGARWHDCIATESSSTSLSYKNNRVHSITERSTQGWGVRVNIGGRTGFSYTNDPAQIEAAARRAVALAPYGDEEGFDLPANPPQLFDPYDAAIEGFDSAAATDEAQAAIDTLRGRFPGAMIDLGISASRGALHLANSAGFDAGFRSSYYGASVSLVLTADDGTRLDVWEGCAGRGPRPLNDIVETVARKTADALTLRPAVSGTMPVLFTPKAVARLMGIVTGGLNARAVWKGVSPFAGKIGERLFSESLTIIDDPRIEGSPYAFPFDDEGVAARRKPLVERGVIARYVTDLKHAERLAIAAEGNGSRGYSSLPAPATSALTIDAGPEAAAGMPALMGDGILVDQFIGLGQSNTLTGEFAANLDLAYRVEKGVITGRVKDCMIAGNLFTLLAGAFTASAERLQSGSVLAPWILFPAVDVSG